GQKRMALFDVITTVQMLPLLLILIFQFVLSFDRDREDEKEHSSRPVVEAALNVMDVAEEIRNITRWFTIAACFVPILGFYGSHSLKSPYMVVLVSRFSIKFTETNEKTKNSIF